MSQQTKETEKSKGVDEELSDLLDSALEDFSIGNSSDNSTEVTEKSSGEVVTSNHTPAVAQEWSNDFVQEAAKQFEDNLATLLSGANSNVQVTPDMIEKTLQQMADAAQQVLNRPQMSEEATNFSESISQAVQSLSNGAEDIQAPLNEEDFIKMFSGSGLGQENNVLPFMQGMMQGLLSKEVLAPSLEDFVQKIPEYIENNKKTLDPKDIERYVNQQKLMEEVLQELNSEKESDLSDVKTERFSKVLALMQKLQDYGQPPAELVGDCEVPFKFDEQGNVLNPGSNSGGNPECSLM